MELTKEAQHSTSYQAASHGQGIRAGLSIFELVPRPDARQARKRGPITQPSDD
jgi:hypothetical protein